MIKDIIEEKRCYIENLTSLKKLLTHLALGKVQFSDYSFDVFYFGKEYGMITARETFRCFEFNGNSIYLKEKDFKECRKILTDAIKEQDNFKRLQKISDKGAK